MNAQTIYFYRLTIDQFDTMGSSDDDWFHEIDSFAYFYRLAADIVEAGDEYPEWFDLVKKGGHKTINWEFINRKYRERRALCEGKLWKD